MCAQEVREMLGGLEAVVGDMTLATGLFKGIFQSLSGLFGWNDISRVGNLCTFW